MLLTRCLRRALESIYVGVHVVAVAPRRATHPLPLPMCPTHAAIITVRLRDAFSIRYHPVEE